MEKSGKSDFRDTATQKLKESGLRLTIPRKLVIELLRNTKTPLSAYRIKELANQAKSNIDVVSIYRTLATFDSLGLIHRVHSSDGFMPCTIECHSSPGSEHAICDNCGNVTEHHLSKETAAEISMQMKEIGFRIRNFRVEIEGNCINCETKSPSSI